MNHETAQAVIQRQAMQNANLQLQLAVAEVELEEAREHIKKLEGKTTEDDQ